MRATASPSAQETNVTARLTASAAAAGQFWDVKDVDTSADGTLVVFAMRGPLTPKEDLKKAPGWRVYQYTIASDTLAPVIDPATDPDPPTVNDVSPHYLPDGRIVFSTTRQSESQGILLDQGDPQFSAQDEDRNEPAFDGLLVVAFFLVGLAWIVAYYLGLHWTSSLGAWNVVIGFAFIAGGFVISTRWH